MALININVRLVEVDVSDKLFVEIDVKLFKWLIKQTRNCLSKNELIELMDNRIGRDPMVIAIDVKGRINE